MHSEVTNVPKGRVYMKRGKAFEIIVKNFLIGIGFLEVCSDKLYIYDGPAGQMIQGLGNAHNADVLLEPMVQTPFYTPTRLLIECKDYDKKKVGLDVVRGVLGLREDINHFEIVDTNILQERRKQNRNVINNYSYIRYVFMLNHDFDGWKSFFCESRCIPG